MPYEAKTRDQIDRRWTWNLEDLYPTAQAWEEAFAALQQAGKDFTAFAGTLTQGEAQVRAALDAYFEHMRWLYRLYSYANLFLTQDNGNPTAQALLDRMVALAAAGEAQAAFLRPELLTLPEETLRGYAASPLFADYDVYLQSLLRDKPHTLSEPEERLLSLFGEVSSSANQSMEMLTYVDMRFPNIVDEQGDSVEMTEGRFLNFLQSKDRRVRADAFENVLGTYAKYGNTLATMYGTNVKSDLLHARARRFTCAREMALFPDEVPEAVYDSLLTAVHKHLPTLARYVALRRRALGIDEVHLYDLYTPMVQAFDIVLPYPEAYELVIEGVSVLGEEYTRVLRQAYAERWIDVYENRGKNTGAFCAGSAYGVHPYVLLNYEEGLRETLTIAHEMGHAMHSYYAMASQPFPKFDYTIFVAEVASTVNEVLVLRHLMRRYPQKEAQAALINQMLENFRTTVFRQTMFAEFEHIAHAMAERGEALTRESLCAAYLALNQQYYGQEAVVDERIADEWLRIPHFYSSFYVYKYATGFSAAVSIVRRILNEGEPAVRDYMRFLKTGASMPPIEELKLAGVDMSTPVPVESALAYFAELIAEFEALL